MPCRNVVTVYGIRFSAAIVFFDEMQRYLVAEKIEIGPSFGRAPGVATEYAAVKRFGSPKIVNGYREMKRLQGIVQASSLSQSRGRR